MREICTSGSVRGGDGNIPTYSAVLLPLLCDEVREGAFLAQSGVVTDQDEPAGGMKFKQPRQEQAAEQSRQHAHGERGAWRGRGRRS